MEYILLILVVILFTNKQYTDSWKKDTYRKSNIYMDKKRYNIKKDKSIEEINNIRDIGDIRDIEEIIKRSNGEDISSIREVSDEKYINNIEGISDTKSVSNIRKISHDEDISSIREVSDEKYINNIEKISDAEDVSNTNDRRDINNIINKSIKDLKKMEIKKIKPKHLENIKNDIVKVNNEEFDLGNDSNGLNSNLIVGLEVKDKLAESHNEKNIKEDIIYKGEFNEYNYDEKYSLVDICEDNKENDIKNECYKENVIDNISENLEYKLKEEKVINDESIIHKESEKNKDNKKIIKEDMKININNRFNNLKNKYKGVNVYVLISGGMVLEGEIVFDFPNIIALKNKDNIIVFINEDKVLSIF